MVGGLVELEQRGVEGLASQRDGCELVAGVVDGTMTVMKRFLLWSDALARARRLCLTTRLGVLVVIDPRDGRLMMPRVSRLP